MLDPYGQKEKPRSGLPPSYGGQAEGQALHKRGKPKSTVRSDCATERQTNPGKGLRPEGLSYGRRHFDPPQKAEEAGLASEVIEDFAGQGELVEAFFFGAKFRGVGNERAAGAAGGMFDVQHFVKQDVFDDKLRDARPVHAAIQQNLIGTGIVAAKLPPPATDAPTDVGPAEFSTEIF